MISALGVWRARQGQSGECGGGQERAAEVVDGADPGGVGEQPAQQQAGKAVTVASTRSTRPRSSNAVKTIVGRGVRADHPQNGLPPAR